MKINTLRLAALGLFAAVATLDAAPLTQATAVFTKPDAATQPITLLAPGTEPTPAADAAVPVGWVAISLAGPHTVYVANNDVNKALNPKPDAAYRTAPKVDAPVLAYAKADDKAQLTGVYGPWTVYSIPGAITGYIQTPVVPTTVPAPAPAPVANEASTSPAKVDASATVPAMPGTSVPIGDSTAIPHFYQGSFVTARSLTHPFPAYTYQINDAAGRPYAYIDLSNIFDTVQINDYLGRTVTVYGVAQPVNGDGLQRFVIRAQSIQLQ